MLKVDVDEQKRAVGKELRARIIISLKEPLPRGVAVFSSRRQRKEWYDVVYERVPFFCFSCGIIGHSEIECPKPAIRDEKGCLPYSEKLRAPEERRMRIQGIGHSQADNSIRRSNSSGTRGSSDSKKSTTKRSDDSDKDSRKGDGEEKGMEESSPIRNHMGELCNIPSDDKSLDLYSMDGNQTTFQAKKRKSDE